MLRGCYWPHQFGGPLLKSYVRGMSLPLIKFFIFYFFIAWKHYGYEAYESTPICILDEFTDKYPFSKHMFHLQQFLLIWSIYKLLFSIDDNFFSIYYNFWWLSCLSLVHVVRWKRMIHWPRSTASRVTKNQFPLLPGAQMTECCSLVVLVNL
jgi:hypothetical protein